MKRERWEVLEKSLENLQPYYRLMNKLMSFGNDTILREKALDGLNSERYLDAGTGLGDMAYLTIKKVKPKSIVLLDPSIFLLKKNGNHGEKVMGKFENIPFKDSSFDLITCAFSFRDAIDHEKAGKEISRVLEKDGFFVLVDLGKPDSIILKFLFYIYIFFYPIILSIFVTRGKMVGEYSTLFYTFLEYPSYSKMKSIFESNNLVLVKEKKKMFGGLIMQVWKKYESINTKCT